MQTRIPVVDIMPLVHVAAVPVRFRTRLPPIGRRIDTTEWRSMYFALPVLGLYCSDEAKKSGVPYRMCPMGINGMANPRARKPAPTAEVPGRCGLEIK